jgi:hypothetical protein
MLAKRENLTDGFADCKIPDALKNWFAKKYFSVRHLVASELQSIKKRGIKTHFLMI